MDILKERYYIENSWSEETTYSPDNYIFKDPATGQCAVSALLLQSVLGGELIKGYAVSPTGERIRHYWNRIFGVDIDFTWRQFPAGYAIDGAEDASTLDLLGNQWFVERYQKLVQNYLDFKKKYLEG